MFLRGLGLRLYDYASSPALHLPSGDGAHHAVYLRRPWLPLHGYAASPLHLPSWDGAHHAVYLRWLGLRLYGYAVAPHSYHQPLRDESHGSGDTL